MINYLYEKGLDADEYLTNLKNYKSLVRSLIEAAEPDPEHVSRLSKLLNSGSVRATAMTEDWSGDSACNLPVLTKLLSAIGVPFRILIGSEHPDLRAYYHEKGVNHIPVISFWDEEGNEIGRWVEQPAAVSPRKDAWKAERPEFMELYRRRETDKEAGRKFATMYRQLLEEMATWYRSGLWKETTREIVEILEA